MEESKKLAKIQELIGHFPSSEDFARDERHGNILNSPEFVLMKCSEWLEKVKKVL